MNCIPWYLAIYEIYKLYYYNIIYNLIKLRKFVSYQLIMHFSHKIAVTPPIRVPTFNFSQTYIQLCNINNTYLLYTWTFNKYKYLYNNTYII